MTFGSLNLIFHIHIFLFHTPYPTQAGGRNAVCLCFNAKKFHVKHFLYSAFVQCVSRETF